MKKAGGTERSRACATARERGERRAVVVCGDDEGDIRGGDDNGGVCPGTDRRAGWEVCIELGPETRVEVVIYEELVVVDALVVEEEKDDERSGAAPAGIDDGDDGDASVLPDVLTVAALPIGVGLRSQGANASVTLRTASFLSSSRAKSNRTSA